MSFWMRNSYRSRIALIHNASVVRPDFVKATVLLIDGREITIDCNGLLARCLQHECDHLNGILFVERVSSAQKITLRNKLKRLALGY